MDRPRTPTAIPLAARVRPWFGRHRVAVGLLAAAIAAGMSVLWFVVVPDAAGDATGWRAPALRLGHGLCWALLSLAALLHAANLPRRLVAVCAYAALASYGAFLAATLL